MLNRIHSEWIKLSRRPLTWILLAVFLLLMVLQFFQFYILTKIGALALHPDQVEDIRHRLVFPGAFGAIFGHINGLGGLFAAVLTAGMLGGDYSWGTLRTYLARRPERVAYLSAKLIVLVLALLVAMLISLVVGSITAIICGLIVGEVNFPDLNALLELVPAMLRALVVLLPYVLATAAAVVYGRSLLIGMIAGIIFQFVDIGFGALATYGRLGGLWQLIYNCTVQANISTLTYMNSIAFGLNPVAIDTKLDPTLLPPLLQALIVIAIYCVSFLAVALIWFRRADVTSGS